MPDNKPPLVKNITKLSNILVKFLWASISLAIILIIISIFNNDTYPLSEDDFSTHDWHSISLLPDLVFKILFFVWIYRVNSNCGIYSKKEMDFSPVYAVGCYFIPFVNFLHPYNSMKEIWDTSKTNDVFKKQTFFSKYFVVVWWLFFWFDLVLSSVFDKIVNPISLEEFNYYHAGFIGISLFRIIFCLVNIKLIKAIYQGQKKIIKKI
jgi:uncharacterized BrkB/YihY/UPF0761 family membrane protein